MTSETVDLGYRPHRFQMEMHERARRFTVVVAHRRFGKTLGALATLTDAALRTGKEKARFAYMAPFLKQAKRVSWDYARDFARKIPGTEIRENDLSIQYPNGARLSLYGADNAEALRGVYLDGIVPDEMADYKPDVWGSIIRPALSDRRGWAFFIGTPKGINQFSELYQYGLSEVDPDWVSLLYRADETDRISEEELRAARRDMSDAQYRQEFLCDFSASSDNMLITIDTVSDAAKKVVLHSDVQFAPKIVGVDVARFGDDRSVIQKRHGLIALEPTIFRGVDNMTLAGRVAAVIDDWQPDAVFIDAGRGEGVIDRLRQLGYAPIEVNFGGKPIDPGYVNKRSEMWDTMARWFETGAAIPNHPELKSDLCVPTYKYDAAGRFALESKDDIKKRGMRSPDVADALALTFAFPVVPSAGKRVRTRHQSEYDPFARYKGQSTSDYSPFR